MPWTIIQKIVWRCESLENSIDFYYYKFIVMKAEKVFVRYKVQDRQQQPYNRDRDRQPKRTTGNKKVYAQKTNRPREAIRQVIDNYEPLQEITTNINRLFQQFPKFFNQQAKAPEKDGNEYLNEYVIFNAKKYVESLHQPRHSYEAQQESSDPDWNSDDNFDGDLESKSIDIAVIQKINEKFGDKVTKKHQILKRHQKQFLEDYIRSKRINAQQQKNQDPIQVKNAANKSNITNVASKTSQSNKDIEAQLQTKLAQKPKNIWSQYHEKQVDNFVDMGFMTKVYDNQEGIQVELAQDDGMFNENSEQQKSQKKDSSSDDDEDDIFKDDQATTTTIKTTVTVEPIVLQSDKKITQGTVFINDQIFSKIAEEVGLIPLRCVWIISNESNKFRVSTEYMDTIYRKQKMNQILPLISLNHSEFVANDEAESHKGMEIFRKYNARRQKIGQHPNAVNRVKHQYKQKNTIKKQ